MFGYFQLIHLFDEITSWKKNTKNLQILPHYSLGHRFTPSDSGCHNAGAQKR